MTETPASRLSELYLYQNAKTGQASITPISVEQLCRILGTGTTHVTANTMVWKVDETPTTNDAQEWKVLKDIPVLLEASAQWYYTNSSGESKGPVNAKALEHHRRNGDISNEKTMVWSPQLEDRGWFPLEKSQELMLALKTYAPPPLKGQRNEKSNDETEESANVKQPMDEIQAELKAFLSSADLPSSHEQRQQTNAIEEEGYQSDGGTNYVKDPISGKWIHEALAPTVTESNNKRPILLQSGPESQQQNSTKQKRKKAKFAARNAKCWIYVSGLPLDTDEDEVSRVFSKVGILDLDSDTQKPKIKLYSNKNEGKRVLKGDASICFARPESVGLALQLLDETPFRLEHHKSLMRVERAKFEQRGDDYKTRAQSWQKRQVAKTATLQAVGWDEGLNGRITGGMKGLTIIVLKNMFSAVQSEDDDFLAQMERGLRQKCHEFGTVEKITVFASNPEGVVIVRFKESAAATNAIQKFNGEPQDGGNKIEAHFWDGVTDYTVKDEQKEEKQEEERHKKFGDWLENSQEDLPEELRLRVEA